MIEINFEEIRGDRNSKEDNFAELVTQLIISKYPEARSIEGRGGDEGVDTFIGSFHGEIWVFQSKYYPDSFGGSDSISRSRRVQVEKSLRRAREKQDLKKWTLCLPKNLNPYEQTWFDSLKAKYPDVDIDYWGESHLRNLLLQEKNTGLQYYYFCKKVLSMDLFRHQIKEQMARQIKTKKYIPEIFTETGVVKEKCRYLVNPCLFIYKIIDQIKRLNFNELNRYLRPVKTKYPYNSVLQKFVTDNFEEKLNNLADVMEYACLLLNEIEKERESLINVTKRNNLDERYPELTIGQNLKLKGQGYMLEKHLQNIANSLKYITSRVCMIIDSAGKGKTNFICDFAENFILKQDFAGIFLAGNNLNVQDEFGIESYILKIIGIQEYYSFEQFLAALQYISEKKNQIFTFIIDAINENTNIQQLSVALEKFTEKLLNYKNIRAIYTCRSEYFRERFGNLEQAFPDDVLVVKDKLVDYRTSKEKKKLYYGYLHFFKINPTPIGKWAKDSLADDPLLLRFFCEAYGDDQASSPIIIPQLDDIYQDEIFKRYFDRKIDAIASSWITEGKIKTKNEGKRRVANILNAIIDYMLNDNVYHNIPLEEFNKYIDTKDEFLFELWDEDILFRKDIDSPKGLEEFNFTFDESRDYLLAKRLLEISKINKEEFSALVTKLTNSSSSVAEGVSEYLFLIGKQENIDTQSLLGELYDSLFPKYIFYVNPEKITDQDVYKLKQLLLKGELTNRIISYLIRNWDSSVYKRFNLHLFLGFTKEFSTKQLDLLFQSFIIKHKEFTESIFNFCQGILNSKEIMEENASEHDMFELLILIFGNPNKNYRLKAVELFKDYLLIYPLTAFNLLRKYWGHSDLYVREMVWANTLVSSYAAPKILVPYLKEITGYILDKNIENDLGYFHVIIRDYIKNIILHLIEINCSVFAQDEINILKNINMPRHICAKDVKIASRDQSTWTGWENDPIDYDMKKIHFASLAHYFGLHRCDATDEALQIIEALGYTEEEYSNIDKKISSSYQYQYYHEHQEGTFGKKYAWQAYRILQGKWLEKKEFLWKENEFDEKLELKVLECLNRDLDPFFPKVDYEKKPEYIKLINFSSGSEKQWLDEKNRINIRNFIFLELNGIEWVIVHGHAFEFFPKQKIQSFFFIRAGLIHKQLASSYKLTVNDTPVINHHFMDNFIPSDLYWNEVNTFKATRIPKFNTQILSANFEVYPIIVDKENHFRLQENVRLSTITATYDFIKEMNLIPILSSNQFKNREGKIVVRTLFWNKGRAEHDDGYLLMIEKTTLLEYLQKKNLCFYIQMTDERNIYRSNEKGYSEERDTCLINAPDQINKMEIIRNYGRVLIKKGRLKTFREKWIAYRLGELAVVHPLGNEYKVLMDCLDCILKQRLKEAAEQKNIESLFLQSLSDEELNKLIKEIGGLVNNED